ncbi:MAG: NAD-dependent epimerase/dehydratase family protein, partial [Candidatus Pacebacteria bacterium]|nr:NAD-dependent epimerase/dehydratase family protein [Candidatus Paceibacterota bacterium]
MRILVTGGAGFIGSHLVALLASKGIEVRVLDSLVSGKRERVPAGVDFIQGDIRDRDALMAAMKDVTQVVHLAALVSVAESMADPLSTHEVNVTGTEHVLQAMRGAGVKRIVYASSAAVYGDEPSLPKRESSPLQPQSPYALSKVINEAQAGMYERAFGLSPVGLRFFNVYGPGQAGNHPYASVIPRWIEAVRAGRPVTVYGDGSQTRDFVHVRDVAQAIYLALVSNATGVFNIASGEEVSLTELAQIMCESIHTKHEPSPPGDILRS